jgi:hypothetical protein
MDMSRGSKGCCRMRLPEITQAALEQTRPGATHTAVQHIHPGSGKAVVDQMRLGWQKLLLNRHADAPQTAVEQTRPGCSTGWLYNRHVQRGCTEQGQHRLLLYNSTHSSICALSFATFSCWQRRYESGSRIQRRSGLFKIRLLSLSVGRGAMKRSALFENMLRLSHPIMATPWGPEATQHFFIIDTAQQNFMSAVGNCVSNWH